MKVFVDDIGDYVSTTIYSRNGVEVKANICLIDNELTYEAYINGEYVMLSRNRKLSATLSVLNYTISLTKGNYNNEKH